MSVVVVDSGVANLGSVLAAFARAGVAAMVSRDAAVIASAERVVLPGVGAAGAAMRTLRERGLIETLRALTQPVLGICLGMQLLFERSAEGDAETLGVIPGVAQALGGGPCLRVPHMGWNRVDVRGDDVLTRDLGDEPYAYFVHSYALPDGAHTLATCDYGGPFAAIVRHRNFCGAQFHPERSAAVGARLLRNFAMLRA